MNKIVVSILVVFALISGLLILMFEPKPDEKLQIENVVITEPVDLDTHLCEHVCTELKQHPIFAIYIGFTTDDGLSHFVECFCD